MGCVRRTDLTYAWHDLELFATDEPASAGREDREVLERCSTSSGARLLRSVKGNRDERSVVLDILGVCSVLETPQHRGFADGFVRADARPLINRRAAATFGLAELD